MNSLIPTAEQQCIIMRSELAHQQLSITEEAHALSLQWFQKWKRSAGFYTKEMPTLDCPPIDNTPLIKNTETGQKFNSSLIENVDFIIIPRTTWEIFHSWYGGGPSISFQVEYNPIQKKNVAVTRKLSITVTFHDQPFKITASPFKLFSQIKFSICKYLKIEADEYSIYKFINLKKDEYCEDSKSLCELEVKDNDEFVIAKSLQNRDKFPKIDLQMTRSVSYSTLPNKSKHPGIFGLQNFGNSCYFNSGVQCLLHTNSLVDYIKSGEYVNDISISNPLGTKGYLIKSFASLVTEAWRGIVPVIAPRSLFSILQDKAPFFSGFQQQDAHELILYLLDLLHEDLNRVHDKPSINPIVGDGINDIEIADQTWQQHKSRNDSIIVDLFHGLLRSSILCPTCHKTHVVFEPYVSLPMTIPDRRTCLSFIFIPFDILNRPNILIKIPIQLPIEMHVFKQFLAREIGYDCNVVFAIRNSSYEHSFFKSPPSIPKGSTLLVFEVPSTNKMYSLVRLNFKVKGLFNYTDREKYLDSFLIELPEASMSWAQLQFAVDERFHYLWDISSQKVLTKETKELYDMQKSFQRLGSDSKLVINEKHYVFEKNDKILFLSNNVIDVTINGSFINENEHHFNWSRVIRETIEHEATVKIQGPTLEKSFHEFFSKSKILDSNNKWYCPDCKKYVCAEQKIDLWKLPNILIVQFKRFAIKKSASQISVGSPAMKKIETNIEYPDEIDLGPYVIGPEKDQNQKYKLFAVVHHFGKLNGGHYTTSAVVDGVKKWYYFNDNTTKESDKEAHAQSAYVLFYEKLDQ